MEQGWDPQVKKFLLRILQSISIVLLWMLSCATAGIYYKLGYFTAKPLGGVIIFYALMLVTLFFLVRYLLKLWRNG